MTRAQTTTRTPIEQIGDRLMTAMDRLNDDRLSPAEREQWQIKVAALRAMMDPCKPLEAEALYSPH